MLADDSLKILAEGSVDGQPKTSEIRLYAFQNLQLDAHFENFSLFSPSLTPVFIQTWSFTCFVVFS